MPLENFEFDETLIAWQLRIRPKFYLKNWFQTCKQTCKQRTKFFSFLYLKEKVFLTFINNIITIIILCRDCRGM